MQATKRNCEAAAARFIQPLAETLLRSRLQGNSPTQCVSIKPQHCPGSLSTANPARIPVTTAALLLPLLITLLVSAHPVSWNDIWYLWCLTLTVPWFLTPRRRSVKFFPDDVKVYQGCRDLWPDRFSKWLLIHVPRIRNTYKIWPVVLCLVIIVVEEFIG